MDLDLLDQYVIRLLENNGWSLGRRWEYAEHVITEIENLGYQSFQWAWQIIFEMGGLSLREYAPLTYQKLIQVRQRQGKVFPENHAFELKASCERCLQILSDLDMEYRADEYNGATFSFDALAAARDAELVLDRDFAESIAWEALFPIGTIAPDGISFVGITGKIYTVFDDSIYLSGERVEEYLNGLFFKSHRPKKIYQVY